MSIESPNQLQELPVMLIKNMITLATSGFGLVIALAWNEAIQSLVKTYIDPFLGKSGTVLSLLVYAVIVTILAVIASMQLTLIQKKIESFQQKEEKTTP